MPKFIRIFVPILIAVCLPSVVAQDSRPASAPASQPTKAELPHELRQDPQAMAILQTNIGKVYRARENGLKDIKVKVAIAEVKDGASKEIGSFSFEWTGPEKNRVVDVVNLKAVPSDILLEMVGPDTLKSAKANHVAFVAPTTIELRAPEWISPRPIDHFLLTFDEKGLLQKQEIFDAPDHLFQTTTFTFQPLGERFLITRRDHARGGVQASSEYEYKAIDGVTLMTKATIKSTTGATNVITFSDHAVNKGLVIK